MKILERLAGLISVLFVLLAATGFAQEGSPSPGQTTSLIDRAEAGNILLVEGIDGLKRLLENAGAPALTFDQETQIRNLHDLLRREGEELQAEREADPAAFNRVLADQLFLAAIRFLNP